MSGEFRFHFSRNHDPNASHALLQMDRRRVSRALESDELSDDYLKVAREREIRDEHTYRTKSPL